jgi:hypothetical protein
MSAMANENMSNDSGPLQPPEFNYSALGREHNVHRKTIKRWIEEEGWRPGQARPGQDIVKTAPEILPPVQEEQSDARPAHQDVIRAEPVIILPGAPLAHLDAHPHAHPARAPRRWRAAGRGITGLVIAGCGIAIAATSIRANAWFGRSLTTDTNAGEIFSHLSVLAEIVACAIPTAGRFYWQDGDRWTALRGFLIMAVALTVVFFAASGFVLTNISAGTEARGDRTTPAVELAQRTVNTLAKSREDECKKRGDRCRDLEAQERKALADLAVARAEVRAHADPQPQALHVDSNTVRTIQAAAMVGMCLIAGYIISFGAGLIWPRG